MNPLYRALITCVALLLCCVPATSSVGGGGESGIWILPSSRYLDLMLQSGPQQQTVSGRAALDLPTITSGLFLQMPPDMGVPVAMIHDPLANVLPSFTFGNRVFLPMGSLVSVRDGVSGRAGGLIMDAAGRGFWLNIMRGSAPGSLQLTVN